MIEDDHSYKKVNVLDSSTSKVFSSPHVDAK